MITKKYKLGMVSKNILMEGLKVDSLTSGIQVDTFIRHRFEENFHKTCEIRRINLFTHSFPIFVCILGACTGLQPDNIVRRRDLFTILGL